MSITPGQWKVVKVEWGKRIEAWENGERIAVIGLVCRANAEDAQDAARAEADATAIAQLPKALVCLERLKQMIECPGEMKVNDLKDSRLYLWINEIFEQIEEAENGRTGSQVTERH